MFLTPSTGVFLHSGGSDQAVALYGDSAPDGGTLSAFPASSVEGVGLADSGDLAFRTSTTASGPNVWLADISGLLALATAGDPAPDSGSNIYIDFNQRIGMAPGGAVVFNAQLFDGSTVIVGTFAHAGGVQRPVVLAGQLAPGTGGGTFNGGGIGTSINSAGEVALTANFKKGLINSTALFASRLAAQPAVPGLGPAGLLVLISSLLGTAWLHTHHRRS